MKKPTKPNYDDKPYTPSVATDVLALFKRLGWVPPSEQKAYQDKWAHYRSLAVRVVN